MFLFYKARLDRAAAREEELEKLKKFKQDMLNRKRDNSTSSSAAYVAADSHSRHPRKENSRRDSHDDVIIYANPNRNYQYRQSNNHLPPSNNPAG